MNALAAFVGRKMGLEPLLMTEFRVVVDPARVWSEWTAEDWSCTVSFMYMGSRKTYYLDEEEAADFLRSFGEGVA